MATTDVGWIDAPARPRPLVDRLHAWVTTVDHKRLGILYVAYGLLFLAIGGIEAATMAGIMAAANAERPRAPAATSSATGSQKETRYSWLEISRPAPTASGIPSSSPTPTRSNAPRRM